MCEAAEQEQGAQPHGLEVLRESCLERRRSQLRALTELLASGPDQALRGPGGAGGPDAAGAGVLRGCPGAAAAVPPPEEPELRARVEALQEQVDRLEALYEAGKYQEGLQRGEALLRQVEPVPYVPLHARALYVLAALTRGQR